MYNGYDPYSQFRQGGYGQPIQNLTQTIPTQAQTYFVSSLKDMESIKPALNVVYIGINKDKNEIYMRQMNNAGLIDCATYSLSTGGQEKNDLDKILERIDKLENKVLNNANNTKHGAADDANVHNGQVTESPVNATV